MAAVVLIAVSCGLVGGFYLATFWACLKASGGMADVLAACLALLALGYFAIATIWIPTPVTWVRESGLLKTDGEVLLFAIATVLLAVIGGIVLKRTGYVSWVKDRISSGGES